MKTAREYILAKRGIEIPLEKVSAEWYLDHNIPMIVECRCCETTMFVHSAMVDDDGYAYCGSCAE